MNLKTYYLEKKGFSHPAELKKLYKTVEDPWNYETSEHERFRFETTLALAKSVPHTRILEIGCAEGHFTKQLKTISKHITAIDLSEIAVNRAKKRIPDVNYQITTFENLKIAKPFDLTICSEVLYYAKEKQQFVDKMAQYSKYILTSHTGLFALAYSPYFSNMKRLKNIFPLD